MKNKIMKNLKKSIVACSVSCCASYTLASVLISLLNINEMNYNIWVINIELFFVCFVIALLMLISNAFLDYDNNIKITFLIGFAEVAVPVLVLGGPVFNWFDLFSPQIISPVLILSFVYIAIFILFYLHGKKVEREINKKISERKERIRNDKQDN